MNTFVTYSVVSCRVKYHLKQNAYKIIVYILFIQYRIQKCWTNMIVDMCTSTYNFDVFALLCFPLKLNPNKW